MSSGDKSRVKVYYCSDCLWSIQVGLGEAIANRCDNCGRHGLMFLIGDYKEVNDRMNELIAYKYNTPIKLRS